MPIAPPRHNARRVAHNRKLKNREYNRVRRTGQEFYNSQQWRKLRAFYIREHPLCEICKAEGRTTAAEVVDHITEIKKGGAALDMRNLQSLCHLHHNQKTAAEQT